MSQPLPLREQMKALEGVQELDFKIDSLKKSKGELPAALKTLDDKLARMKATIHLRKSALGEIEKTQKQTQAALDLNRDRQARSSSRLEGVQNSQEFQAASKEVDQLKKQKESLEEQIKKSGTDTESVMKDVGDLDLQLAKAQEERDAQAALLTGQTDKLGEEISRLMKERSMLTPKVEATTLARYDRVRAARAGLGIVPAVAGRCKGCNIMVPPQQYNELQRGTVLHSCPSCHRLLFVPEASKS